MNKIFASALFLASLFICMALCSCGDNHLASEGPQMYPYIIATPDKYNGALDGFVASEKIYAAQNQTVKLYAAAAIGNSHFYGDDIFPYFKNVLWEVDGELISASVLKYSLKDAGRKKIHLTVVDFWNDTTHRELEFFVNAPNKISIDFPYDGYNQVDPENTQSLPLQWTMEGIDEWENATCAVFAYSDKDSLWDHPIAIVDCFDEVSLQNSLVGNKLSLTADSSFSFYWAVKAVVTSEFQDPTTDSTEIARFSTRISGDKSVIKIPFVYDDYYDREINETSITVVSSAGDTLDSFISQKKADVASFSMIPRSNVKVYIQSINRREYMPEVLSIDIPPNTVYVTDTVHFVDKIPPQIALYRKSFAKLGSIGFYVYDDGSGFDFNNAAVTIDKDTVSFNAVSPNMIIPVGCHHDQCLLQVYGEDFAGNKLPDVSWLMIMRTDSVYVYGPYPNEEK